MTIDSIEITNVKGIASLSLTVPIRANRANILVAPNGFGKSSLATAFASLNNARIDLHDDHRHQQDETNLASIRLSLRKRDGTALNLTADEASNTISGEVSCFVINNLVRAKATKRNLGSHVAVSASLEIDPVILIDKIPENVAFNYNVGDQRTGFGSNGKILPNIKDLLSNERFMDRVHDELDLLERSLGKRPTAAIASFQDRVNSLKGTSDEILKQIDAEEYDFISNTPLVSGLANLVRSLNISFKYFCEPLLIAIQIIQCYKSDKAIFKAACERNEYNLEKQNLGQIIKDFNPTWKNIRPKEHDGQLIVEFPKAHLISNGQRDVLTFISMLHRARKKFRREHCILIIDEIFDYLDDANLIAAQFYVSEFINELHQKRRKEFYPIILTHLNPTYFKTFAFSDQVVHYLLQANTAITPMQRLVRDRTNPTIANDISKYLLHFDPGQINRRTEFRAAGLRETWGEGDHFVNFLQDEADNYFNGRAYDPFAVCCFVRRKIEERTYNLITPGHRMQFLTTHTTSDKLLYAQSIGVNVLQLYYLLGIVYNDGLHWKNNLDNVSPLVSRLENGAIRHMIRKATS